MRTHSPIDTRFPLYIYPCVTIYEHTSESQSVEISRWPPSVMIERLRPPVDPAMRIFPMKQRRRNGNGDRQAFMLEQV